MKSKSNLAVISLLLAIVLAGCSRKATSNANTDANTNNTNATATTQENGNLETEETADDSSTTPGDNSRSTGRNTRQAKSANGNSPTAKRSPEKETPLKPTEKRIRKQGERILRDSGGLIKEGEKRVRGILDGKP